MPRDSPSQFAVQEVKDAAMTKGRILVTGVTIQHVGRDPRLRYDHLTRMYVRALRAVGYEVEHREVQPDEDVSGFSAALVGMGPVNGLACRYTYTALDIMERARESGVGLLLFCDDWQVQLLRSGINTMVNSPQRLVRPVLVSARAHFEWACANVDRLMKTVHRLQADPWPTTIIPQYSGGSTERFSVRGQTKLPSANLVGVDPTSYGVQYGPVQPPDQEKWGAWILGTLSNQQPWVERQRLRWPLGYFGGKASKSERGPLPESELVQQYSNAWGVLSPPYWHVGSGWWRLRHDHAVQAGSVLLGDPRELGFMGDCFQLTPSAVEDLSITQLRELASAQAAAFRSRTWSAERLESTLDGLVQSAVAEVSA